MITVSEVYSTASRKEEKVSVLVFNEMTCHITFTQMYVYCVILGQSRKKTTLRTLANEMTCIEPNIRPSGKNVETRLSQA